MSNELTCLRIIADFPGQNGIHVNNIVKRSRLPIIAVDRALSGLRASGFVARPKFGSWSSPGYTITDAGMSALESSA